VVGCKGGKLNILFYPQCTIIVWCCRVGGEEVQEPPAGDGGDGGHVEMEIPAEVRSHTLEECSFMLHSWGHTELIVFSNVKKQYSVAYM